MKFSPIEIHKLLSNVKNLFDKDKCWLRGNDSTIYTRVPLDNGRSIQAHVMSLEYFRFINLNKKAYGCHYCDIKSCINPDHIFGGTPSMNLHDFQRKNPDRNLFNLKPRSVKAPLTFCGDFGKGY